MPTYINLIILKKFTNYSEPYNFYNSSNIKYDTVGINWINNLRAQNLILWPNTSLWRIIQNFIENLTPTPHILLKTKENKRACHNSFYELSIIIIPKADRE